MEKLETWVKYESGLLELLFVRKGSPSPSGIVDFPPAKSSLAFSDFSVKKVLKVKTLSGNGFGLPRKK
jgi:hypothetical protein